MRHLALCSTRSLTFEVLCQCASHPQSVIRYPDFDMTPSQALLALFRLAPNPEQLCGALLKSLESSLFTQTVAEKSQSPTMTSATTEVSGHT